MAVPEKALPRTEEPFESEFLYGVLQKNKYDS